MAQQASIETLQTRLEAYEEAARLADQIIDAQADKVEALQDRNQELKAALEKAQTTAHYALKDAGDREHRGIYHNCPAPACVEVRVLIGKDLS